MDGSNRSVARIGARLGSAVLAIVLVGGVACAQSAGGRAGEAVGAGQGTSGSAGGTEPGPATPTPAARTPE